MAVVKLGTVWVARATLYNKHGVPVGTCMDTPNSIAKAMMEHRTAAFAMGLGGTIDRKDYKDRMKGWNTAQSHFQPAKRGK